MGHSKGLALAKWTRQVPSPFFCTPAPTRGQRRRGQGGSKCQAPAAPGHRARRGREHCRGIFASCLALGVTRRQAWRAASTHGKQKETEGWLRKQLGDKSIARSAEFCFIVLKGEQLNCKGKPHVRWKHFESFFPGRPRGSEME